MADIGQSAFAGLNLTSRDNMKKRRPLPGHAAGAGLVLFSVAAFVVGIGAPGLGWSAALLLLAASASITRHIGSDYAGAVLLITAGHGLFSGPLADGAQQPVPDHAWVLLVSLVLFSYALWSLASSGKR